MTKIGQVTVLRSDPEWVAVLFGGKVTEMPRNHWEQIASAFEVENPGREGDLTWIPDLGVVVQGSVAAYRSLSSVGNLYDRKKENEPNVREK